MFENSYMTAAKVCLSFFFIYINKKGENGLQSKQKQKPKTKINLIPDTLFVPFQITCDYPRYQMCKNYSCFWNGKNFFSFSSFNCFFSHFFSFDIFFVLFCFQFECSLYDYIIIIITKKKKIWAHFFLFVHFLSDKVMITRIFFFFWSLVCLFIRFNN